MSVVLEKVTKTFEDPQRPGGRVTAVDDVSLEIAEGELVTLLGPSGCGKTTALRMIAGFELPTAGRILVDGQDVSRLPPHARNAAMVFQSYAIFPHLTVARNVAFGLEMRGLPADETAARVRAVLELVELAGLEHRSPEQLSGGQQQRVALARAIVTEPRVLLFDEPLSNLDAKLREQMRVEVRRLQRRLRITSVYVTHDQAEAMALSDRIVVMEAGRVQQVAAPFEVYAHPANRFVADFLGRVNFLASRVVAVGTADLTVEVHGRRMDVPAGPARFAVGDAVTLVVRPETIAMRTATAAPNTGFRGIVRRAVYLGATAEYEVDWNGTPLLVVSGNPLEEQLIPEGSAVSLDVSPRTIHLLAADPPATS
jgi:iron(III) transport system ATP-binding protein